MTTRPPTWLSKPAVLWAMDEAPGVPARLVSTLFVYARYADEEGRGAYPASSTVALHTRKSKAQAARDAAELERLGLLLPGNPDLAKGTRADRRPKVYDLAMPRGASRRASSEESRGASGTSTRRIPLPNEAHLDAPEQILNRSRTSPARARTREPADIIRAAYPDATDDEIEILAKDRADHGARSLAAVLRHEIRQGTLRLPCDRDGKRRHSEACRVGDSRGCGMNLCACRCHTKPAETTPAQEGPDHAST